MLHSVDENDEGFCEYLNYPFKW